MIILVFILIIISLFLAFSKESPLYALATILLFILFLNMLADKSEKLGTVLFEKNTIELENF
jgi:Ca2+/Na+ antiporter